MGAVERDLRSGRPAERDRALAGLPALLARDPASRSRALTLLRRALRTGGPDERAAVVRALPTLPGPEGVALWLSRLDPAEEPDDRVLEAAVSASAARRGDHDLARRLTDLARDRRVSRDRRALALEALGGLDGRAVGILLSLPLEGGDWVTESARALALGRRGGRESVPALLDLLGHEDGAVRTHAWEALTGATGVRLPAERDAWAAWWERERGSSVPLVPGASEEGRRDRYADPAPAHVPHYYGIPLPRPAASHVVFCLDVSQSMWGGAIARARRELARTIRSLPTSHRFDVVAFHESVDPCAGRLVRAHPVVKARVLSWLDALETVSYTNVFDAVETAFGYGGRGRRPVRDPMRLDAVFLLSDGAPNRGRFHVPAHVVREVAVLSRGTVPVHTVAAGDRAFPLLRSIAAATGGIFVDAFE